jgi:hypothetical protein
VRQFARYRSASDPRTQIPAPGLLPFKPKRARPYLYTDAQIQQVLTARQTRQPRHAAESSEPSAFHFSPPYELVEEPGIDSISTP